jgi:hypothetical protein
VILRAALPRVAARWCLLNPGGRDAVPVPHRRGPNAIAFESKQFNEKEFVRTGSVASLILLGWMLLMITVIWPAMGVEVVTGRG